MKGTRDIDVRKVSDSGDRRAGVVGNGAAGGEGFVAVKSIKLSFSSTAGAASASPSVASRIESLPSADDGAGEYLLAERLEWQEPRSVRFRCRTHGLLPCSHQEVEPPEGAFSLTLCFIPSSVLFTSLTNSP